MTANAEWGAGPWDQEPDRAEWYDAATDYPCLARRNPMTGTWCGYVAVPPGHVAHGKILEELDNMVTVHGGVTHNGMCSGDICHVPREGEPDNVWWVGFDCAHTRDLMPYLAKIDIMRQCTSYRDLAYVRAECTELAKQLAEAA